MNKQEAGQRGGIACRLRQGTDYVPVILIVGSLCQLLQFPIVTEYFSLQGSKGGDATLNRHGRDHFSAIGKLGGRPRENKIN